MKISRLAGAYILSVPLLVACGKSAVPVSIHGVNYSVEPFSFELQDPIDSKNRGDGELVDSYAAGGTTCCYELPKKWQPGLKIIVRSKHWVGKSADDSLHDVTSTHVVEVPRYADGNPGEIWVLRAEGGGMAVVSSDFQPDRLKWPGKVKGWPLPSLAYQRERRDLYIEHQQVFIDALERLTEKLNVAPDSAAQEEWDHYLKYDRKKLVGFGSPRDPNFREKLKKEYAEGLEQSRGEIKRLQRSRP